MFWIICAALAVLVATLFVLALLRGRIEAEHPATFDLRIYRDQLREVERDLARGVLGTEDAERTRAEVGRRVLAANAQLENASKGTDQPRRLTLGAAALSSAAIIAGGLALYAAIGAPGQGDLPHAARMAAADDAYENRPSQEAYLARLPSLPTPEPDEEYTALISRLRAAVAENPDDLQGQSLLATNEARLGNFDAARTAQRAVIRIKGQGATAEDHITLAQLYVTEAQGYVSPKAEAALRSALEVTGDHPVPRYFLGQMWLQNDRPDRAFRLWSRLLSEGPETAPWIEPIRAQIDDIAWLAGIEYTAPEPGSSAPRALPGPSAEEIEDASDMSPAERMEMIEGMVSSLSQRLATEGGTPDEWSRLIAAYGALGNSGQAAAIWQEAQKVFAERPDALETVRRGAQRAGVDQ